VTITRTAAMAVFLPLLLGACHHHRTSALMTHQDPSHVQSIGMPNPASAHCIKIGGRLEIRNDADGAVGICHLPDGTKMEEWALFRRDMGQR